MSGSCVVTKAVRPAWEGPLTPGLLARQWGMAEVCRAGVAVQERQGRWRPLPSQRALAEVCRHRTLSAADPCVSRTRLFCMIMHVASTDQADPRVGLAAGR